MTSTQQDRTDFRSRAVAASEAMLRSLRSGLSPQRCGLSYCLERQPSLSRLRAPIKITAVVAFVLLLSGIATGGIIPVLCKTQILPDDPSLLFLALGCMVGGILSGFLPTFVERLLVRRHLRPREEEADGSFAAKGIHVALEYAPTYGSMKILAEDVGLIYVDPEAQCLRIEGLSYVYVVQSKDVVSLSLHSNRKSVRLSYLAADEPLDIVIEPRSIWAEVKRQKFGSSRGLFVKIRDALEPPEDEEARS